jgi:hypothetical protein
MSTRRRQYGSVFCVAAGVLLAAAAPAAAGTIYRWKAADGSIAYADDLKRVPERYREHVETLTSGGLGDYKRYTPTDSAASREYRQQLAERLDSLREWNARSDATAPLPPVAAAPAAQPSPAGVSGIALQSLDDRVGRRRVLGADGSYHWVTTQSNQLIDRATPVVGLDRDPQSDAPVVMEQRRVMDSRGIATQHVTVVRQGDKVLSVIAPRDLDSSIDFPRRSDLER